MLSVLQYLRKRRPQANFSLEFIFEDVRARLKGACDIQTQVAPKYSSGLFPRLAIVWDVFRARRNNIHVTGDINFAILGTRKHSAILTLLDCGFLHRARGIHRSLLKKLWLTWPVYWSARVTTISQAAKNEIVELSGCNPEKVVVVPVAISEAFTRRDKEFNGSNPRILHIGTAPNKNLLRHIEALKDLECTLVIIGVINEQCMKLLQEYRIRFENYVDLQHHEVVAQYEESDLILFASTHEGFGMPILEAQAVGRPVVTSKVSSMPEVAGDAALLVNPLDVAEIRTAVVRLLSDSNFRVDLVSKGFENVKRFDGQAIANLYLRIYEEVWGKNAD